MYVCMNVYVCMYVCMVNTSTICTVRGILHHYFFPQLFVKNVKSDTTTEEISELFSVYGRVFDVQKHPNRRSVAFVVSAP